MTDPAALDLSQIRDRLELNAQSLHMAADAGAMSPSVQTYVELSKLMQAAAAALTHQEAEIARVTAERDQKATDASVCGGCGGPYRYDVSIPSVLWNRIVRERGGSEYLCATCVFEKFAREKQSFTAELYGLEFAGQRIEVMFDNTAANVAAEIQDENNALRWKLHEAEVEIAQLRAALAIMRGTERTT